MKKLSSYTKPAIQVKMVAVENGFVLSEPFVSILCGSENIHNRGNVNIGTGENNNGSMMEGIGDNGEFDI